MKQFKTKGKDGGHPLILDDIEFIQDAIIDAIARGFDWMGGFDQNNVGAVILAGLFHSGNKPSITDNLVESGSVYLNIGSLVGKGEIFAVDELASVGNRANFDYYIEEIPDPVLDPTIYQTGANFDVHITRKLVAKDRVAEGVSGLVAVDDLIINRIEDELSNGLFHSASATFRNDLYNTILSHISVDPFYEAAIKTHAEEVISSDGWINLGASTNVSSHNRTPQIRRYGNRIELRGSFEITSDDWYIQLPNASYSPPVIGNGGFPSKVWSYGGAPSEIHQIVVAPFNGGRVTGSLLANGAPGLSFPKGAYLDGLVYYLPDA